MYTKHFRNKNLTQSQHFLHKNETYHSRNLIFIFYSLCQLLFFNIKPGIKNVLSIDNECTNRIGLELKAKG